MELKLKELLDSINTRFSGPQSCRLHDMITGRIDFDDEEVKGYLTRLMNFGAINGNHTRQEDSRDAKGYLKLFNDYILSKDKDLV